MLSLGYSNITPFDSPRELEEDELFRRVEAMAGQVDDLSHCVFNLHVPPYASQLDTAAELDDDLNVVLAAGEPKMIPVGSTAVREAIERFQPIAAPPRPRPRVARGDPDRPHAVHQPGQRLPHGPHLRRARPPAR